MASNENEEHSGQITAKEITSENNDSELSGDSDSDYSITCDPCNKTFSGYIPYKIHIESQPHLKQLDREKALKNLKKSMPAACNLTKCNDSNKDDSFIPEQIAECTQCKKSFYDVMQYTQHLKSNKHQKKLKELELIEKLQKGNVIFPKQGHSANSTGNIVPLEEKLLQKFKKEVSVNESSEEDESDDTYTCKDCKKAFSGVKPYFQHIVSPAHEKKQKQIRFMRKYLREKEKENASSESEDSENDNETIEAPAADTDAAPSRRNVLEEDLSAHGAQKDIEVENDNQANESSKTKTGLKDFAKTSYKAIKDTYKD